LATGEFAMGYYHEIGIHVPIDVREAKRWYELAAEHGNNDAVGRLESLSDQKTLTKKDHETTTLTRIKSQHGSMRGKRPERLAARQAAASMPAVAESDADQARLSPLPSPRHKPTGSGPASPGLPDISRLSVNDSRGPSFSVNVDGAPGKPVAAAPYPMDDRPMVPTIRSQSAAPYPEDDVGRPGQAGPHYDQGHRAGHGPRSDRPGSAFGIKPINTGPGGSGGAPPGPGGFSPGGYRHSGSSLGVNDHRRDPYMQDAPRPATTQPYDGRPGSSHVSTPQAGRQPTIVPQQQRPVSSMAVPQYAAPQGPRDPAAQPGYGPRTSSRPVPPGQGPRPTTSDTYGRNPSGGWSEHPGSLPPNPRPPHAGSRVSGHADRPRLDDMGRVGTAPAGPSRVPVKPASPSVSTTSAPARPPPSQGPATFEEMGIPQGKTDGDCVSSLPPNSCFALNTPIRHRH
jgi:hypothetical protein